MATNNIISALLCFFYDNEKEQEVLLQQSSPLWKPQRGGASENVKLQVSCNYPPTLKSAGLRADCAHLPHSRCIRTGIRIAYLIARAFCQDTGLRRERQVGPVCQGPKMGIFLVIHITLSISTNNRGYSDMIKSLVLGLLLIIR